VTDIAAFIRRLPKAELHLHLEGTIVPTTLVELSARHDAQPLTQAEPRPLPLHELHRLPRCLQGRLPAARHAEDYELAAWRMIERLAEQGVVHAEVYVSVGVIYMSRNHDPAAFEPIFAGLERAANAARASWASRFTGSSTPSATSASPRRSGSSSRLPKCGRSALPSSASAWRDERRAGSEPFRRLYAEAKAAGLRLTNHAGETTGPEAIREALAIGSERIGHAVSAVKDFYLMEELKARAIPLELNPTRMSAPAPAHRLPTPAAPLLRRRPAGHAQLRRSGVFGSDLANEFLLAHTEQGFTRNELRQLAANSIRASFLPELAKVEWLFQIDTTSKQTRRLPTLGAGGIRRNWGIMVV